MARFVLVVLAVCAVMFFIPGLLQAAEHPGMPVQEHPGMLAQEHPGGHVEHPGSTHAAEHPGETNILTADMIIKGIKNHINDVTSSNGGVFPITDPVEGKNLRLVLVRVHEDRVSYIKKQNAYFACTDFKTEDGSAAYDLDFWMQDTGKGGLKVYKTKIHKKDGVPRFTYKDDEIVPVPEAAEPHT